MASIHRREDREGDVTWRVVCGCVSPGPAERPASAARPTRRAGRPRSRRGLLQEAGLIEIEKRLVDKRTQTPARLSDTGREAVESYWREMAALRESASRWRPLAGELAPANG